MQRKNIRKKELFHIIITTQEAVTKSKFFEEHIRRDELKTPDMQLILHNPELIKMYLKKIEDSKSRNKSTVIIIRFTKLM